MRGIPYNNMKNSERGVCMEPYKAKKMPLEYEIDKELLKLTAEANVKYGEY